MLPKNRLASKTLAKLKIYAGTEHPHQAQLPEPKELAIKD
jgi:large subunit ribosomal protein L13